MGILLRLAWRNLWRHKRRTWLTASAIAFSAALLVFMITIQLGAYEYLVKPIDIDRLRLVVRRAAESRDAERTLGQFVAREPNGAVNQALSAWKELTAPRPVRRTGIPASGV